MNPTNQSTRPSILSHHDIIILHVKNIKKTTYHPFNMNSERWTKWQTPHPTLLVHKSDW